MSEYVDSTHVGEKPYLDPHVFITFEALQDWQHIWTCNAILCKNLINLFFLSTWAFLDFAALPIFLDSVTLGFSFGSEPGSETHRNGTRKKLCDSPNDDDMCRACAAPH